MHPARLHTLNDIPVHDGPVVYWMSRDMRARDNWALLHAQELALEHGQPLVVVFCLVPRFLDAALRQYDFMLHGLQETEQELRTSNIPFALLSGAPGEELPRWLHELQTGVLVTDFDPLRLKRQWKREVCKAVDCAVHEVDAHNIVPCWEASPKQEFAAYTIRPKIARKLPDFLHDFPALESHPHSLDKPLPVTDWKVVRKALEVDTRVPPVDWAVPGTRAGMRRLKEFIKGALTGYDQERNDPNADAQSNLSPYLHFGQVAPQRVALEVRVSAAPDDDIAAFLEELIVRRELSDNFCYYNEAYDRVDAFPDWAKMSHAEHGRDPRPYEYTYTQFEESRTHDELWNAAQRQMVTHGKMHGYLRMYWAKKILEWTASPADALDFAIRLNDHYELDGRDPNGYAGIAWSVGGVHDRAWPPRPVFGKIRCMTYNGCKGKFDVKAYSARWSE